MNTFDIITIAIILVLIISSLVIRKKYWIET